MTKETAGDKGFNEKGIKGYLKRSAWTKKFKRVKK